MSAETEATEIGVELPSVVKKITPELLRSYSNRYPGVFIKTIHVDKDAAGSWGFPDLVLQGSQTMNFAAEMMFKVYRENWINDSSLSVKFIKPVFNGQTVTTKGKIINKTEESGGTLRLKIDVWAENQSGEKVMVGEAGVVV